MNSKEALLAATLLAAGCLQSAHAATDDQIELSFNLKLFGNAKVMETLPVAQGTAEFAYGLELDSPFGTLKCAKGTTAAGLKSARTNLLKASLAPLTHYTAQVNAGEEVLCTATEDRKLQITYRIAKNAVQSSVSVQIEKTLNEIKSGNLNSNLGHFVFTSYLEKNLKNMTIKAGRAEVMVMDAARASGTPMIGLMRAGAMNLGGSKIAVTGKKNTANPKNIYPQLNRFALVCGFANPSDGKIAAPRLLKEQEQLTTWTATSSGKPFGCISNNSPDGFDSVDPYVEDPFYSVQYLIMPLAEFKSGLEQLKVQIAESLDQNRAEKLEKVAANLLESNKQRVQSEMDRRRSSALAQANLLTEAKVELIPLRASLQVSAKPRYVATSTRGELHADTVFDVQGEKMSYAFQWPNGKRFEFTEDQAWTGLSGPMLAKDFAAKYAHLVRDFNFCASESASVQNDLLRLAQAPETFLGSSLLDSLSQHASAPCTEKAVSETRVLKYVRYEGACFEETAYRRKDSDQDLVRFKPTQMNLVYSDASGHATAKAPFDLSAVGQAANLFTGLDVSTTLPYDSARAASAKIDCEGSGHYPFELFSREQLRAQSEIPGFQKLLKQNH